MIALKLQQIGPDTVIVFDPTALAALGLQVGDTVHLQRAEGAVIGMVEHDVEHDARVARGRAFLKRQKRTFEALERH